MGARQVAAWAQSFRVHGVPAVSPEARVLALDLALYAAGGAAFPSINTLKETHDLGYAKVRAALDELIAAGWFTVEMVTRGAHGGVRPMYLLNVPAHAQSENDAPFLDPAQSENDAGGTIVLGPPTTRTTTVPRSSTTREPKGSLTRTRTATAPAASGAPCPQHPFVTTSSKGVCASCRADQLAGDAA